MAAATVFFHNKRGLGALMENINSNLTRFWWMLDTGYWILDPGGPIRRWSIRFYYFKDVLTLFAGVLKPPMMTRRSFEAFGL
jgi:hypothetical protein